MDLTKEQQKELVNEAWDIMKKNKSKLSHHFFITIHKNDHTALKMFSFINNREEALKENDDKLKGHAMKIFEQIYELAVVADKTRKKLDTKKLGFVILDKTVTDKHYQVVKEALLSTVEKAMGEKWSEEKKAMEKKWIEEKKAMEKKWSEEKKWIEEKKSMEKKWNEEKNAKEKKWSEEKKGMDKAWGVAYEQLVAANKAEAEK